MKPKFLFVALLLCSIGLSAFAQKTKMPHSVTKTIYTNETFSSLSIEDDISVVLTEGNSNEIIIKGDESSVNKLMIELYKGNLRLSCLPLNLPSDVKVYIPATLLNRVNVYGKSELTSSSILSNPKLRVIMAGEGKVNLRSTGKVVIEGTDEFDFVKAVR